VKGVSKIYTSDLLRALQNPIFSYVGNPTAIHSPPSHFREAESPRIPDRSMLRSGTSD
jgi:hypothetical protein